MIVDEVVTGIYELLVNYAADAAFIKSQYNSSTCTDSCNDGEISKKSLFDLFLHGSRNTSIIDQSVLSRSMVLRDIQNILHK